MNMYKVAADGSLVSLRPKFVKTAAGNRVTIPILGHVDIDIRIEDDGSMVIEVSMPPGSHNGGFKDLIGIDDSEVVINWINENILNDPEISSAMDMSKVHVELKGADQFSAPLQELIDSQEMRPQDVPFYVSQKPKAPAAKATPSPVIPEESQEEIAPQFAPSPAEQIKR